MTRHVTDQVRDLNNENILGSFYTRELSPANQNIFIIENVIKRYNKNKKALVKCVGYSYVDMCWAHSAGINVVVGKAQLKEKESRYKACHRTFKQHLREVQMNKMRPDVDEREIIRETFPKILKCKKGANYVVPFERYMKKYKLNGYYSKK